MAAVPPPFAPLRTVQAALREARAEGHAVESRIGSLREEINLATRRCVERTGADVATHERVRQLRERVTEREYELDQVRAGLTARDRRLELLRQALRTSAERLEALRLRRGTNRHRLREEVGAEVGALNARIDERCAELDHGRLQFLKLRLHAGVSRWTPSQLSADAFARWRALAWQRRRRMALLRRAGVWWGHARLAAALYAWHVSAGTQIAVRMQSRLRASGALDRLQQVAVGRVAPRVRPGETDV